MQGGIISAMTTDEILLAAKKEKRVFLSETEKNRCLECMADCLLEDTDNILKENESDIENAKGRISDVMIDRLRLTKSRIEDMADGIRKVALLPDPTGIILEKIERADGLLIEKISVPLGVVAIIYESRPNVTSDAASLAIKSGNVCILRSGKDALKSASAITAALKKGLARAGVSENRILLIEDPTHESANRLMKANDTVDLLIPRGGASLISACVENATVPCIQTGTGICHIFVDESADFDMALRIIENAKTSRPSVCNAEEVLIVHSGIANSFLPKLKELITDQRIKNNLIPVKFICDERAFEIIGGKRAEKDDFDTEFLDYILAVKVVDSVDEAINHIEKHSTRHSDGIITKSAENAEKFTNCVDSSSVYVNASTRFTDGGEFGLGCEMGISTQKLHARGPMGLRELTTYKYIIKGNGHIR